MSCHQYSYSTLGTNCAPQTVAWTNDNKFLKPDASVYHRQYTHMRRYPAQDSTYTDDQLAGHPLNPEQIKAFYIPGHSYGPWDKADDTGFVFPTQYKRPASCTSCSR